MEGYLKHVALVDAVPKGGLEFSITDSKSDGDNVRFPWYLDGSMHKPCPVIAARTGEKKFWMKFDTGADGIMVDPSVMPSDFRRHVITYNIAGGVTGDEPANLRSLKLFGDSGRLSFKLPS